MQTTLLLYFLTLSDIFDENRSIIASGEKLQQNAKTFIYVFEGKTKRKERKPDDCVQ